ncbi:MAG: Fis family transcriptional regulator [Gammaproteobacteria bacterium]|nr:MAG: Fis family transcriptional regulator [Gammaproteobacteria bacterium]RLA60733.1 MAG: Fis family transcriptional regulator [Gammaproteobacteria bacterium]
MAKRNPRAGSSFNDFLKADGIYEDVQNTAIKKALSAKLEAAMFDQNISKTDMAKRLKTSRSQLDRLLDPDNETITLQTASRAAAVLGMTLEINLSPI